MKIKVSDYIAQKLVDSGIHQVFTVTGGGAMHLNDSLGHQEGMHCLYQHHEQACAIAAETYARINNTMALLCVTTGPGGTNAITGVVGGWLDSIPMLVISGQVRYDTTARWSGVGIRSMGDQEFDITKSIACMTKYSEMVTDVLRIRYCLEKAIYLSYSGRPGPTWLDIPLDIQGAFVDTEQLVGFDQEDYEAGGSGWAPHTVGIDWESGMSVVAGGPGDSRKAVVISGVRDDRPVPVVEPPHATPADYAGQGELRQVLPPKVGEDTARAIVEKIKASKRPVFNAGNGIRIAGAHGEFMEVAERLGVPVVVGWNSQDCMHNDHPLYVGRAGGMGDRPGNFAIQNSDLVFSVGSRLSIRQVGYNYKTWAREAYVIVNDVDREELKKPSVHVDMPVHGDAKDLLEAMLLVLKKDEATREQPLFCGGEGLPGKSWVATCRMWRETYPVILPKHLEEDDTRAANVYALVKELSDRLEENQITIVGNGSACVVGGHGYMVKKGQRFISNSAIASMGYDLPGAIGVCVAASEATDYKEDSPAANVILLTGDGSIQMNLQELQTIIHHRMPIKIFLINNGGYHSIRQTQKNFFGEPLVGIGNDSFDLSFPDMEKLAAAYGYPYVAAHHNTELATAIEKTLETKGPAICEVYVSIDQNFEPKSAAKRLPDGTMTSPPLEDLAPFLPDEEMDAMMIIPRIR